MRMAVISDIHGNRVALETVLHEIGREHIDLIACLGDVAEVGPQPIEVIERLQDLGCPVVMGNTDDHLLRGKARTERVTGPKRELGDIDRWALEALQPAHIDYLGTFRESLAVRLDERTEALCYHGSPQSFSDRIVPTTAHGELESIFATPGVELLLGGHTHHQMARRWNDCVVANPGSVGLALARPDAGRPLDQLTAGTDEVLIPWAEYAMVDAEGGRLEVALRRSPFDLNALLRSAHDSGMPHVDWWARKWRAG